MAQPSQQDQRRGRHSAARADRDTDSEPEEASAYSWTLPPRAMSPSSESSVSSEEWTDSDYKQDSVDALRRSRIPSNLEMGERLGSSSHRGMMARWIINVEAQHPQPADRRRRIADAATALLRQIGGRGGYGTLSSEESYGDTVGKGRWHVFDEEVAETEVEEGYDGLEACRGCDSPWQVGMLTIMVLFLIAMTLWLLMPVREPVVDM